MQEPSPPPTCIRLTSHTESHLFQAIIYSAFLKRVRGHLFHLRFHLGRKHDDRSGVYERLENQRERGEEEIGGIELIGR
jgi:hypothetical protein